MRQSSALVDGATNGTTPSGRTGSSQAGTQPPTQTGTQPPTPRRRRAPRPTRVKVTITLSEEALEAVQDLAEERDLNMGEVIRQALTTEKYFDDLQRRGKRILVEDETGHQREIVFSQAISLASVARLDEVRHPATSMGNPAETMTRS